MATGLRHVRNRGSFACRSINAFRRAMYCSAAFYSRWVSTRAEFQSRIAATYPLLLALQRLGLSTFLFRTTQQLVLQLSPETPLLGDMVRSLLRPSARHGSLSGCVDVLPTAG